MFLCKIICSLTLATALLFSVACSNGDRPTASETRIHFGCMDPQLDFAASADLGIEWVRHFVTWERIESEQGKISWSSVDEVVKKLQGSGFSLSIVLMPFTSWDQQTCHAGASLLGPPCDETAYLEFVKSMVERYDGDGKEDMPGLTEGILYWEIFNEPALMMNWDFTAQEYVDLLAITYPVIKAACAECVATQGGEAGYIPDSIDYIQDYLGLGAGNYFDVANMHFIHDKNGFDETFYAESYSGEMASHGLKMPLWISEVQIQCGPGADPPGFTEDEAAGEMVKAYARAFGTGIVDRILYAVIKEQESFLPIMNRAALIDSSGRKRPTYFALKTIIAKLKNFHSVEDLSEDASSGNYRFDVGSKSVYLLWGSGALPAFISGQVTVTQVDGTESVIDAASVTLSDDPIFVTQ